MRFAKILENRLSSAGTAIVIWSCAETGMALVDFADFERARVPGGDLYYRKYGILRGVWNCGPYTCILHILYVGKHRMRRMFSYACDISFSRPQKYRFSEIP